MAPSGSPVLFHAEQSPLWSGPQALPPPSLPASPPASGQSSRPGEAPCSNTPAQGRLGGKLTTAGITTLGAGQTANTVGLENHRTLLGTISLSPRPPRLPEAEAQQREGPGAGPRVGPGSRASRWPPAEVTGRARSGPDPPQACP